MELKFFNTISGEKEIFQPENKNHVKIYSCGPTVYNFNHIGNFRYYIFCDILRRSLKIAAALAVMDLTAAYFSSLADLSPIGVMGDMLLIEVAVLFLLGGLVDFASSLGVIQFRKVVFSSKDEYSAQKRKETEQTASVFIVAGILLVAVMILLTLYRLSTRGP